MLKIKNYIFPIEQIVYINYSDYSNIIYVSLKDNKNVIQIAKCTQEDFDSILERVGDE